MIRKRLVAGEVLTENPSARDIHSHVLKMLLEGIPADRIIEGIERTGHADEALLRSIGALNLGVLEAGRRLEACKDHATWMAGVYRALQDRVKDVDVVHSIDAQTFYRDYYAQNRPVLIEDVGEDGKTRFAWTFERLKQEFGNVTVDVMRRRTVGAPDYVDPSSHSSSVALGEFIDEILSTVTNDVYMTSKNSTIFGPLGAIFMNLPLLPHIMDTKNRLDASLWMGPEGAISSLHYDRINVMIRQLLGVKRVLLTSPHDECFLYHDQDRLTSPVDPKSPDLERYPLYRFARTCQVDVPEGSALFIPIGWWHHVESLSPSFSVSMSNFSGPHDFPANLF